MYCNGTDWIAFGALNPSAGGSGCTNPDRGEGAVVYNNSFHVLQYCDGDDWRAVGGTVVGGGGCIAPASCPDVGDVCSDGSIFAGFMDYSVYGGGSCKPLYVTDNNQSTASQWKTATGTNDITDPSGKVDAVDGQYNRDNRGSGTFPAFELCEDNTYHGKSDWYLPARTELNLLWLNQAAIDANAAGNFTTSSYWSSTEYDTVLTYAWYKYFGLGGQLANTKTNDYAVRCVRRDDCPNVGDLCSDGSIFAGDTNMYVTDVNQSTGIQWASTGGNDDINPDSGTDGAANHANVTGSISTLPALNLCETLNRHGHTDWYLPARNELDHLYTNRTVIGGFTTSPYWSSTESSSTGAWRQFFDGGAQLSHTKTNNLDVRCIRRQ